MDVFQIIIVFSIVIGIFLVIRSLFMSKNCANYKLDMYEHGNFLKFYELTIDDVEKSLVKFNEKSNAVFQELDERYDEFSKFYSFIEEKKNETSEKQPKTIEISELNKQGLTISEMAKKLNMGQGEVKLILELGKDR